MTCENCNQKPCACAQLGSDPLIVTPSLALFDPARFRDFAQEIFKETSLKPFDLKPFDPAKPNRGVQRISHGATHHARVAMWVRILANLCKAHDIGDQEELSEKNIRLLQYVALFHDAARENDDGKDIWEAKSAAACKAFLVKKGISAEEAERFSSLIIKKEDPGLLGKILQSADCLDIMRCKKVFYVERMLLYADFKEREEAIEDCLNLVKDAGRLIQAQSDMRDDVWVPLHGKKGIEFKKSRDAENPQFKEAYELAENCYARVEEDVEKIPLLKALYAGPVPPLLEEKEEYKEEGNNFFAQPEILSYAVIVKKALPAKENLQPKEIYLQKTGSKLAYVFLTPDGELAQGVISRGEIPPPADFSQETVTDELKQRILQWLLENETAVVFQKALRVDPYVFFGDFARMIGGEAHDEEEEDEKKEEDADAEENKALNKMTLRRAREAKKGIYIVNRGKIFISDVDKAGKMIFYGTHEDGTSNGIKLEPHYTEAQKKGYSKPQSVSLLSDKIPTQPLFGFGRAEETPPMVALFPQSATLSQGYFSLYDKGTVGRPGDFGSYAAARAYCDRNYGGENPSIRTEQGPFIEDLAAGKNRGNYTESMMRLKWVDYTLSFGEEKKVPQKGEMYFWREENTLAYTLRLPSKEIVVAHFDEKDLQQMGVTLDTLSQESFGLVEEQLLYALRVRGHALKPCSLGLPANHTLSSRILTQNVAERMQAAFGKKPRIVYMAAFPKEVLYTEALQKQDRAAAEDIASDPQKLSEALAEQDFYFLLGLAPEKLKAILEENPQARLIDFYAKGYVDFAKQLAARANINLDEIVRSFDWASMKAVHPVAVQELALDYPEHYKKLKSDVVNATDAQGKTPLSTALYFGRLKCAVALLGHLGIPEEQRQAAGAKLLTLAMIKGYKSMTQTLWHDYSSHALAYAAQHGHTAVVEVLLTTHCKDCEINPNVKMNGCTALMWAAKNGHEALVLALLANEKTDPNVKDKHGWMALMWPAQKGHTAVVAALLANEKTDPNLHADGWTALMFALKNGHTAVVAALLDNKKTDPNVKDRDGSTALMLAAQKGHAEVVAALLANEKTDPNVKDRDGRTPLMWAAEKGHEAFVAALLGNKKTDPNLHVGDSTVLMLAAKNGHTAVVDALLANEKTDPNLQVRGSTALTWAAQNGHTAVVDALLANKKTDPNLRVGDSTALMLAAQNGHTAVVDALLAKEKTDPNVKDRDGRTALTLAAQNRHTAVVDALLANKKTDPNVKMNGCMALMWAAQNGHTAMVDALLANEKTDPNVKMNGCTALMLAAQNGHTAVVDALLANEKTDPNVKDNYNWTALISAVKKGHTVVLKALLANEKTDPNLQVRGSTALTWVAQNGHTAVVDALLAHPKTNPNFQDDEGRTALMFAAQNRHTAVVDALLANKKTDPNVKDRYDWTALIWAAENRHIAVVEALLSHHNTDPNLQVLGDWTVLMRAARRGDTVVVAALLANEKTDPNVKDGDGCTALIWAAQRGYTGVVAALLDNKKTDPHVKNTGGQTALSLARNGAIREMLVAACSLSPAAAEEKQDAQCAAASSPAAALGNSMGKMWEAQQAESAPQPAASSRCCVVS